MRILFVENRYTTLLWDAVARELQQEGHIIYWIIQNREFIPETGKKLFLDLRNNISISEKKYDANIRKVIRSHRGINHYAAPSDDHVFYARKQINEYLAEIKPDVVFGECTLYHEVITMFACKERNIPYFFPTACRFPPRRFSFYRYETLFPYGGSNEEMPYEAAVKMAQEIGEKKLKPVSLGNMLMEGPGALQRLADKAKILRGYLRGERYNTPSLPRKLFLKRLIKKNIKAWDAIAGSELQSLKGQVILYPLQMQPESTIDVWATDFNDQTQIVENILAHTPETVLVMVKPNPSSALEINSKLIALAKNNPRVIPLQHSVKMDQVLPHADLVVTTTGTIALECIFANKPVLTLTPGFFNRAANCPLASYPDLEFFLQQVKTGSFTTLSVKERAEYLNYLNRTSFEGFISCAFTQKGVLSPGNINLLKRAFIVTLNNLETQKEDLMIDKVAAL